jgi:hypothetical protein
MFGMKILARKSKTVAFKGQVSIRSETNYIQGLFEKFVDW